MPKTASEIVARAMTLIDEQVTEFNTAASTETSMREIGLSILPEVSRDFIKELPYELKRYLAKSYASIPIENLDGGEEQIYPKRKVAVSMPSDFWELVAVRMTVWAKTVTDYILIDGDGYDRQNNPFTRAGKQNPVVALANSSSTNGGRIELFSIEEGDGDGIAVFEYVSFDNVPDDAGNTWPDQLFDEITKALASQLNVIKGRLDEGAIRGQEAEAAISQHGE